MTDIDPGLRKRAEQQAGVCQIFGNVTRILILWTLDEQEMRVSDIAESVGTSLQNASQHLRLMRDRGVLASRRKGHAIFYRIDRQRLLERCTILCHALQAPLPADPLAQDSSSEPATLQEA